MLRFFTGRILFIVLVIGLILFGGWWFIFKKEAVAPVLVPVEKTLQVERKVIGISVEGRQIEAYTYGTGDTHLTFVGGVHGGYEWNSVLLAYELIDYVKANPKLVSDDLMVTIIPSANPDGVYKIIGKEGRFQLADVPTVADKSEGRFNAHRVDLNRNFDCKWKPEAMWRGEAVSAGTRAFSEPEAVALRDFMLKNKPDAVVFWHSQANAVYASECEEGILPNTLTLMDVYAKASGYKPVKTFDSYVVTGDAEGWLASIGIPAITVELETHESIELERNLAGVKAVIEYFTKI